MINRELESYDLKEAFFDVKLVPLFIEGKHGYGVVQQSLFNDARQMVKIPKFRGVVDVENGRVFSVVSDGYKLITNKEAYDGVAKVLESVFDHYKMADFECFNLRMPKSRSFCHIDLMAKDTLLNPLSRDKDPWCAFIRITNSYNKTRKLSYQIGFCRWICKNGVIFGDKSVTISTAHALQTQQLIDSSKAEIGDIRAMEEHLVMTNCELKRYHVPVNQMLPLYCKVFDLKITEKAEKNNRVVSKYIEIRNNVKRLIKEYFDDMGQNGYAALNVLSDAASYPVGVTSPESVIHSRQQQVGAWMNDFVEKIQERGFRFENYIGEEAYETADWLMKLHAVG